MYVLFKRFEGVVRCLLDVVQVNVYKERNGVFMCGVRGEEGGVHVREGRERDLCEGAGGKGREKYIETCTKLPRK